jgi:hypothetical protein
MACLAVFASCKKDKDDSATFNGPSVPAWHGTAHTFITVDKNNKPSAIGIRLSADALNNLPAEGDPNMGGMVPGILLDLPSQTDAGGFDHCEIDWNPHGHEPLFAYGVPHFDFHFYRVSEAEQAQVVPGPDTVPVPAQFIPQDYVSGMMAVPNMGTHWSDTTSPEFHGQPFTATFIYGFYRGHMTFEEPMVAKSYLETKPDARFAIKQPQAYEQPGFYPSETHLYFDDQKNEYVLALEGLHYE